MVSRRQVLRLGGGLGALTLLAACDTTGFNFMPGAGAAGGASAPTAALRSYGTGPVRVELLLPLSGDAHVVSVGQSMANGADLAMQLIATNPRLTDNITLIVRDTGTTAQGAAQSASAAIADGANLILGPLRSEQVSAAGGVARQAGIPMIAFSNNPAAAAPGVYLLNVLPESEVRRSLDYAGQHGVTRIAALLPNNDFGRAQQAAFLRAAADHKIALAGAALFSGAADMSWALNQIMPLLKAGKVGALFMPDRASAPGVGALLQQAGVRLDRLLLIGSADWDGDEAILQSPALGSAIYPAVDDTGYRALLPQYEAKFGSAPNPLATIAFTAVVLADAETLANAIPRYNVDAMTIPGGFNGRDGVFRFLPDGRSQYALVIKQVSATGAVRVDGPKL